MIAPPHADPIGVERSTCKSGTRKYIPLDSASESHAGYARSRPAGPMAWSGARAIRIIRCLVQFIRNVAKCGYGGATRDPTIVTAATLARGQPMLQQRGISLIAASTIWQYLQQPCIMQISDRYLDGMPVAHFEHDWGNTSTGAH